MKNEVMKRSLLRAPEVPKREYHILNLGAGVQSTALYLMFMRGDLPQQLDCAIFADTGDEPESVYRHLAWLQSLGCPEILVRSKGRLSDNLMRGQTGGRFASIPAFTLRPDGKEGKVRRQCSAEYKILVIEQTIRREVLGLEPGKTARGVMVHQYIGISLDEAGRARRIKDVKRAKYLGVNFPLIDAYMTRAACSAYLQGAIDTYDGLSGKAVPRG